MIQRDKRGRFIDGGYWEGKKGDQRLTGERHWNWQGNSAGYSALHKWARKQFGNPGFCWLCERSPKRLEMACINRIYTRSGSAWAALCVRCHRILDGHPYMRKGPANRHEVIAAMCRQKIPAREIATYLSLSPRTVRREIALHGLKGSEVHRLGFEEVVKA